MTNKVSSILSYLTYLLSVIVCWILAYRWHPIVFVCCIGLLFPWRPGRFFGSLRYFVSKPARVALWIVFAPFAVGLLAARRADVDVPALDGRLTWFEVLLTSTAAVTMAVLAADLYRDLKVSEQGGHNN